MPNIKSAKKRVKTISKKKIANNDFKTSMQTAIKKVDILCTSQDKEKATEALRIAIKRIDRTLSKGLINKNTAGRYKSRLTKKVNELK